MARTVYTDPQGTRYFKTSLTLFVPLDLLAFIQEQTGWSQTKSVNWVVDAYDYMAEIGKAAKGVGVTWDRIHEAVSLATELPGGGFLALVGVDAFDPADDSYDPDLVGWEREGEIQDLGVGQILVPFKSR